MQPQVCKKIYSMYTSFLAFNQMSKESPLQAEKWQQKLSIQYVNINHTSLFYCIIISPNVKKLEHKQGGNKRQLEFNRVIYSIPVIFTAHLSSTTQLLEFRLPCTILCAWRYAMPRAMSEANENRKAQLRGTSSFSKTSLSPPFGQYSIMIHTLGTSIQPPKKRQMLGWSSSLH